MSGSYPERKINMDFKDIILREDNAVSMVRVMACILFLIYIVLYVAAFWLEKEIPYFSEFSAFTGSIIFSTLGSKYLDIKGNLKAGDK